MTPNERLDQLEPLLADSLQKIDRLIEGQSQIINEVSKIPGIESKVSGIESKVSGIESKIPGMESNITKTAEAVAKLTVLTQRQYEELRVGQETIIQYLREKLP